MYLNKEIWKDQEIYIFLQTRDADMIQIEKYSKKATIYNIVHTVWLIQGRLCQK